MVANGGASGHNCSHKSGQQMCTKQTPLKILNHRCKVLWVIYGPRGFSSGEIAYIYSNANRTYVISYYTIES